MRVCDQTSLDVVILHDRYRVKMEACWKTVNVRVTSLSISAQHSLSPNLPSICVLQEKEMHSVMLTV